MAAFPEYLWLVVCGSLAAFAFGWATGSNDVANAFGTSVGSKVLTLWQAVIIAAIFEFTGALVLGRVTTSVIAGGIANISTFQAVPEVYAYGMVCNLFVGFMLQGLASYMGLNVSATHCIVGGILGFSIAYGGGGAVNWAKPDSTGTAFPYQGAAPIVLSWFVSPILTGLASAFIFISLRFLVLNRKNAHQMSYWVLPPAVLLTVWVCLYFVFTKGAKTMLSNDDWDLNKSAWVAAVIAAGCALLTGLVVVPLLMRRSRNRFGTDEEYNAKLEKDGREETDAAGNKIEAELPVAEKAPEPPAPTWEENKVGFLTHKAKKALLHGVTVDIHEVVEEDPIVAAIHKHAQVFDPRVEFNFGALQVFSAICVIFAHGANDVGYMTGPLATIVSVYEKGYLSSKVTPDVWVIVLSASGLVVGLATYGYNVTRAMGTMMAKLSPTRGFSAELAVAMVIMVCSQYGLPTSSSQCIVGAIVGVGLAEGIMGVNWKFFAKQAASWLATLFCVATITGLIFAQGVYSPSVTNLRTANSYKTSVGAYTKETLSDFNTTLQAYYPASADNKIPTLTPLQWLMLNDSITAQVKAIDKGLNTSASVNQNMSPNTVLNSMYQALDLVQQNSILTLGQKVLQPGAVQCNSAVPEEIVAGKPLVACPAPDLLPKGWTAPVA